MIIHTVHVLVILKITDYNYNYNYIITIVIIIYIIIIMIINTVHVLVILKNKICTIKLLETRNITYFDFLYTVHHETISICVILVCYKKQYNTH
jgi:hypothetical protein